MLFAGAWALLVMLGLLRGLQPGPGLGLAAVEWALLAAPVAVLGGAVQLLAGPRRSAAALGLTAACLAVLLVGIDVIEGLWVFVALRLGALLGGLLIVRLAGPGRPQRWWLLLPCALSGIGGLLSPGPPRSASIGEAAALEGDIGAPAGGLLLITLDGARADAVAQLTRPSTPGQPQIARQLGALGTARTALAPAPSSRSSLEALLGVADPEGSLAERMAAKGAVAAAFTSGSPALSSLPPGALRGFSTVNEGGVVLPGWSQTPFGRWMAWLRPSSPSLRADPHTVDAAVAHLRAAGPGRHLVWVHLSGPLPPFSPAPPFDTAFYSRDPRDPAHTSAALVPEDRRPPWMAGITDLAYIDALYRGEVAEVDRSLGRLLEVWPEGAPPAVAVVGTHGLSWSEEGSWFQSDDIWTPSVLQVPVLARGVPMPPPPLSIGAVGRALRDRAGEQPSEAPVVAEGPEGLLLWSRSGGIWRSDGHRWERVKWAPQPLSPELQAELDAAARP